MTEKDQHDQQRQGESSQDKGQRHFSCLRARQFIDRRHVDLAVFDVFLDILGKRLDTAEVLTAAIQVDPRFVQQEIPRSEAGWQVKLRMRFRYGKCCQK